jgi:hypothetical protein
MADLMKSSFVTILSAHIEIALSVKIRVNPWQEKLE